MHRTVIGLSAVLLIATADLGAAQDATTIESSQRPECAEYFGCVEYRPLSEAEARSSIGYPRPVAAQSARLSPEKPAAEVTRLEPPSLADSSRRQ